jgi:hypothetical protein
VRETSVAGGGDRDTLRLGDRDMRTVVSMLYTTRPPRAEPDGAVGRAWPR